jgi:hypothetical protein
MDKRVFRAAEVDPNRPQGWIVDLSGPGMVNPDCYWRFRTQRAALRFIKLVDGGMRPEEAEYTVKEMGAAAAAIGRLGGQSTTPAKRRASAANGRKGGRPRKQG